MTSNVDGMFERHGFDKERISTPQGDYSLLQCFAKPKPCSQEVWAFKPVIDELLPLVNPDTLEVLLARRDVCTCDWIAFAQVSDPTKLPRCKNCGKDAFINVRGGAW
jgi:hypothetical protein